jgi:hypothetical protein
MFDVRFLMFDVMNREATTSGGSSGHRSSQWSRSLDVNHVGEAEKYLASPGGAADPPMQIL